MAPYTHLVDESEAHPLSFFETVVGMAYAAFADAPVDVAVVEVGLGGAWDATNVADGTVAVVLPVAVDHAAYLGDQPAQIALEKAGIIKPDAIVVMAEQQPDVEEVLVRRAAEVGARSCARASTSGWCHGCRRSAGRSCRCGRCAGPTTSSSCRSTAPTRPRTRPWRWPRSRPSPVTDRSTPRWWPRAFAEVTSPGRLEVVRRSPTIVLDAAHNPARGRRPPRRRWRTPSPSTRSSGSSA